MWDFEREVHEVLADSKADLEEIHSEFELYCVGAPSPGHTSTAALLRNATATSAAALFPLRSEERAELRGQRLAPLGREPDGRRASGVRAQHVLLVPDAVAS